MWSTNHQGVINKGSGWKTTQQAVDAGWENTFSKDFDGDGLITGGKNYQLDSDNGPVTLKNKWGKTYSDASSKYWDAEAATQTDTGFQVLLDGDAHLEGKHYMWSTNDQAVISKGSGWNTTEHAVRLGWEHAFDRDLNLDGFVGSRIFDASGDASKKEVFEDGALEISYCKNHLSNLKNSHTPSLNILGTEIKFPGWVSAGVTATKDSTGETVDLGSTILDLSKNSFYVNLKDKLDASEGWFDLRSEWNIDVDIDANYINGSSINLDDFSEGITMIDALDNAFNYKGDVLANTFTYQQYTGQFSSLGSGRIYMGRGGTDTLELDGINKADILKFNGSALDELGNSAAGGAALGQQAFYGGTVFDVLSLNNGDEIYLQGIEKISCEDGDIRVRASMSDSTKEQWNLQAMDVSGAWRFNKGSSDVKLVSLDTGIGDISGNASDIDNEIDHVINRSAKNTYTSAVDEIGARDHGHRAMSVMSAKHDGQNLAGIAPDSELWAYNVYKNGDSLYDSINEAKGLREDGEKLVFQGGIQGSGWWTNGSTKAQMETLIESTADDSFFAIAAGNYGPGGGVTGEEATYMTSVSGVAQAQTDNDHVSSVGALEFTGTEVVDGITNVTGYELATYSNRGDNLTYVAPTDSRSINGDGDVGIFNGTSCANPNASGVAALVWSENTGLEGCDVREIMTQSAMDLGDVGRDNTYGHGLLNAEAAVRRSHALAENQQLASFYSNDEFLA